MDALISTQALADRLQRIDAPRPLRIFDATVHLRPAQPGPYVVQSGRADFEAAHIPSAAFVDLAQALQFPLVTTRLRGEQAALAASRGLGELSGGGADDFVPPVLMNSVALARVIAQESDLLVPGTAAMLAEDLRQGRLVRLSCTAPAMRTNDGMLYLRDRGLSPAARAFMATLRQMEAEVQAARAPSAEVPA